MCPPARVWTLQAKDKRQQKRKTEFLSCKTPRAYREVWSFRLSALSPCRSPSFTSLSCRHTRCFSLEQLHPLVVIATRTGQSHFLEGAQRKLWLYTNLLPIFLIKTFCFQPS